MMLVADDGGRGHPHRSHRYDVGHHHYPHCFGKFWDCSSVETLVLGTLGLCGPASRLDEHGHGGHIV